MYIYIHIQMYIYVHIYVHISIYTYVHAQEEQSLCFLRA